MTLNDLRDDVIKRYYGHYMLNDAAHRVTHFSEVEQTALHIKDKLGLDVPNLSIMLVAYFHDLFAWSRVNHHELSGTWVASTDDPIVSSLDPEERHRISRACFEHRSTYKDEYHSTLSELMACADRGTPRSAQCYFDRSYSYHRSRGNSHQASIKNAKEHLKEKFGTGGYARYPKMYLQVFGDLLANMQQEIDAL